MRNSNLDASHLFASTPPRAPPRAWPVTPSAMGKRSHRGKKDKDGLVVTTKQPVKPQSVHDISELFVNGGDLKSLGRASTGPFTADALQARYKHVGKTVDVDKNFDFKTLVTQHGGGGSFSLFGGTGGGDGGDATSGQKVPAAESRGGDRRDDKSTDTRPSTSNSDEGVAVGGNTCTGATETTTTTRETLKHASLARRAAAVEAAGRARRVRLACLRDFFCEKEKSSIDANAAAAKQFAMTQTHARVFGIQKPDILAAAKQFRRQFATEQEMVEAWHAKKETQRESYKKKRRQALRRNKSGAAPGVRTGA